MGFRFIAKAVNFFGFSQSINFFLTLFDTYRESLLSCYKIHFLSLRFSLFLATLAKIFDFLPWIFAFGPRIRCFLIRFLCQDVSLFLAKIFYSLHPRWCWCRVAPEILSVLRWNWRTDPRWRPTIGSENFSKIRNFRISEPLPGTGPCPAYAPSPVRPDAGRQNGAPRAKFFSWQDFHFFYQDSRFFVLPPFYEILRHDFFRPNALFFIFFDTESLLFFF